MISFILFFLLQIVMVNAAFQLALKRGYDPHFWAIITILLGIIVPLVLYFLPPKKRYATQPMTKPKPKMTAPSGLDISSQPKDYRLWYYLDENKQAIGPMTGQRLKGILKENTITPTSYVWSDHMENWKRLSEIRELQTK